LTHIITADVAPAANPTPSWMSRATYALATAAGGCLLSLLSVANLRPLFGNGEDWEAFALGWCCFGIPLTLVLAIASAGLAYPLFLRQPSWLRSALLFVMNVLLIAGAALLPSVWDAWL